MKKKTAQRKKVSATAAFFEFANDTMVQLIVLVMALVVLFFSILELGQVLR
ncbi:MAG: hypothetical protein WD988_02350 [Candidatus Curtissbacteria bacterium]